MPPTPEQLVIEQSNQIVQAPQVQETITKPVVVEEAQVSMPAPQNWIGQIDYGMDWYGVGAKAFNVAQSVYTNVLDYNVRKTVGQISDLQYDLRTKMRNTYSESINTQENMVERPEAVDFNSAFTKSKPFEQEYKDKTNEFIGIKDPDGNIVDVFAEDYDLSGLGTKYMDVVDIARKGLYDLSVDSEKVQRDLLESFETNYSNQKTYNNWSQGFPHPSNPKSNEVLNRINRSISRGTEPAPLDQSSLQEIAKTNPTTADGKPVFVLTQGEDNQIVGFVNKGVTDQELLKAVGEENFSIISSIESARENSARGFNLAPDVYNETVQTLQTADPSPAQVVRLRSRLASMPPEKLTYMFKNAGRDLNVQEQAKLMKAWTLSGMNISQRPEMNTSAFIRELNTVKTADSEMAMAMYRRINLMPSTSTSTSITDNNISQRLEASRQFMMEMLKSSGLSKQELNDRLGDIDSFQRFAQENTQIQPYLVAASLAYDTAIRSGISDKEALDSVKMMYSSSAFADKNGVIIIPRNRGMLNINNVSSELNKTLLVDGDKADNVQYQVGSGTPYIQTPSGYQTLDLSQKAGIDPKFMETWEKDNAIQRTFKLTTLGNSVATEQLPDYLDTVDSYLIPSLSPGEVTLTPEDRLNLMRTYNATEVEDGMHRSENIPTGEALRVAFASHPATIKTVLGKTPTSKEEAIKGAALAYELIQPTEYWQWDNQYSAKDDAFINSQQGGIPLGISSIPLVKPIVITDANGKKKEILNLLEHRNIVTAPNASFVSLEDPNGRPLTYLPFSFFESTDGLTTEAQRQSFQRLERVSKGRPSRKFQLLTGNSATGREPLGLIAAARRLTTEYDQTDDNYIREIADKETPQAISILTEQVSTQEATDAISDPKFLKAVSSIAEKTSNGEINKEQAYEISLKLMNDPGIRDAIKAKVERTALEGKTTKLNTAVSILQGILGYRYNEQNLLVDPEEIKYPQQFWSIATQEKPNVKTNFEWDSKLFDFNYDFSSLGNKDKWKAMGIDVGTLFDEPQPEVPQVDENVMDYRPSEPPRLDNYIPTKVDFNLSGMFGSPQTNQQTSPGTVSDKPYVNLISEFEGMKTDAYWDDTGKVWTIGKGTTTYRDGTPVKKGDKISKEEADNLMQDFVDTKIIPRLEETIPTWNEMNENQQAALISFAYNMKNGQNFYGRKGFETLTEAVSSVNNFKNVPAALRLYNKSGGKKLKGLVRRRNAEANLWSK